VADEGTTIVTLGGDVRHVAIAQAALPPMRESDLSPGRHCRPFRALDSSIPAASLQSSNTPNFARSLSHQPGATVTGESSWRE